MRRRISAIDQRGRRFLEHFLMAPLDGTLALPEIDGVAVFIRQHLHFNVPGIENRLLQVDFVISECPLRLAPSRFQGGLQLVGGTDQPHPFAATACGRFQHYGIANLRSHLLGLLDRLQPTGGSRHEWHAGLFHLLARPASLIPSFPSKPRAAR